MVTEADGAALTAALNREPALPVAVDLETQAIVHGDLRLKFDIDPARRTRLLNGWDDIDLTMSYGDQIRAFKAEDLQRRPWAAPTPTK